MARNRDASTATKPTKPDRIRRALMALSPAALGAAGFFVSGLGRANLTKAEEPEAASDDNPEDGGLTAHRKVYYDRARF